MITYNLSYVYCTIVVRDLVQSVSLTIVPNILLCYEYCDHYTCCLVRSISTKLISACIVPTNSNTFTSQVVVSFPSLTETQAIQVFQFQIQWSHSIKEVVYNYLPNSRITLTVKYTAPVDIQSEGYALHNFAHIVN